MGGFSSREFAQFNGLLASASEQGLRLEESIDLLGAQVSRPRLRSTLRDISKSLADGASLSQALRGSPGRFPPEYCELVEAGLKSNRLAEVLRHAETYHTLRARAVSQGWRLAIYIFFLASLCFAITQGIGRVGHQFQMVYEGTGWFRSNEVEIARHLSAWLPIVAPSMIALGLGALWFVGRFAWGAKLYYLMPLWGRLARSRDLSLACTILAMRLRTASPLPEALRSAAGAVSNRHARRALTTAAARVTDGESLSSALFYLPFFPRALGWAVALGESRSEVAGVFESFSRIYAAAQARSFDALFMILTPLSILAIGNLVLLAGYAALAPLIWMLGGFGLWAS